MKKYVKVRNVAPMAALVAVTATAWATNESLSTPAADPELLNTYATEQRVAMPEPVATPEAFAPSEEKIPSNAANDAARPAPVQAQADRAVAEPPITVEQKRLTVDERIQADVMDRIAQTQNLSGKIGVETRDAVVTLTGFTSTAFQAERAGRAARSVDGVRDVQNLIRARVGGSA